MREMATKCYVCLLLFVMPSPSLSFTAGFSTTHFSKSAVSFPRNMLGGIQMKLTGTSKLEASTHDRRSFLHLLTISQAAFLLSNIQTRPASAGTLYDAVAEDIKKLVKTNPDFGPTLVSGTYDKMSKTGGSGKGTIRFTEELAHGANAGLNKAVALLDPLKAKYPDVSYADFYTLAGCVAIQTLGGPKVPWRHGRKDSMDPKDVTPDGRLPDADKGNPTETAAHLRSIFGRMGFGDREIVALSGAHALGRCHADASGYVGPWTPTPTTFNNLYFNLLVGLKWEPNDVNGKFQYKDPSGKLMMLPSDIVLIQDPEFKKLVGLYAGDEKLWFKDFTEAFQRLEELGTTGLQSI